MKIKCDFCKTEYNPAHVSGVVQCAVCGHSWVVRPPRRRNLFLLFFAAVCALMSACVFAIVVVVHNHARDVAEKPLIAEIDSVDATPDETGAPRIHITGRIVNRSDQIYGVPTLIVSMHDGADRVIARHRIMPPATLLDAGMAATFDQVLDTVPADVRRVSVQLQGDTK